MSVATMVWIVTYRIDSKSPQVQLDRYTEESAKHFAQGIIDAGGVAVITEDYRMIDPSTETVEERKQLQWPDPQ